MNEIEDFKKYLEDYKELIINFESNPIVLKFVSKFNLDLVSLVTYNFCDLLALFCLTDICDKEYINSIYNILLYLNVYLNRITYLDNTDSFLEKFSNELIKLEKEIPYDLYEKNYNDLEKKEIFNELKLSLQYKNYLRNLFKNNNKIDYDALFLFLSFFKDNELFNQNLLFCIELKVIEYTVREYFSYINIDEVENKINLHFPFFNDYINQIKQYLLLTEFENKKIVLINKINKLIDCVNNKEFISLNNCFNDTILIRNVNNYNDYIKNIKIKKLD